MKLSKSTIGIIAAVVIICMWAASAYNSMVSEQEKATTAFANVQSAYQRRADLIPNLVEVVKGYAAHEKETFESVVAARAKATQITVDPSNLTADKLKEFQKAQGELGSALGRLHSWRVLRTASTRLVTSSMVLFSSTTSSSASSQRTSSLASSASTPWISSRLRQVQRTHPR